MSSRFRIIGAGSLLIAAIACGDAVAPNYVNPVGTYELVGCVYPAESPTMSPCQYGPSTTWGPGSWVLDSSGRAQRTITETLYDYISRQTLGSTSGTLSGTWTLNRGRLQIAPAGLALLQRGTDTLIDTTVFSVPFGGAYEFVFVRVH